MHSSNDPNKSLTEEEDYALAWQSDFYVRFRGVTDVCLCL